MIPRRVLQILVVAALLLPITICVVAGTGLLLEALKDEDGASVLSIATLVFRLSSVVAGPSIGAMVDRLGMGLALGVLAAVLGALGFLALRTFSVAR